MNLREILEQHANERMDIDTVNGEQVSADSWTIGDELIQGHPGKKDAGGYSFYVVIDQIVTVKIY